MKRIFPALLLIFALLLSGCRRQPEDPAETEPPATDVRPDPDDGKYDYLKMEPYQPGEFSRQLYVQDTADTQALTLQLPTEWELERRTEGGFSIVRAGRTIGSFFAGEAPDAAGWEVLETDEDSYNGVRTAKYVETSGSGDARVFRCRFVYSYESDGADRTATLTADYMEVAQFTSNKLLYSSDLTLLQTTDTSRGVLSDQPCDSILILGNSFIGTFSSNIGRVLELMMRNNYRQLRVEAISRSYATVGTYSGDSWLMEQLRQGDYDMVFICGFYSTGEVANLGRLKSACDASDTTLVIFPAHNENADAIRAARAAYPDLPCLDWKQELDHLIESGVDRWDLCTDDTYDHSTELAGYVGASMIYRALFNEMPRGEISESTEQFYDNDILGDYVRDATVRLVEPGAATLLD